MPKAPKGDWERKQMGQPDDLQTCWAEKCKSKWGKRNSVVTHKPKAKDATRTSKPQGQASQLGLLEFINFL